MKTHRTEASECPKCFKRLDTATGIDHMFSPKPGDVSVCVSCSTVLIFEERNQVRIATEDDYESFDDELKASLDKALAIVTAVVTERACTSDILPSKTHRIPPDVA